MSKSLLLLVLMSLVTILFGCGIYGPPLPPEIFAPAPVRFLKAEINGDSVELSWLSPDLDRRGEDLDTLTHFLVLRSKQQDLYLSLIHI